MITTQANKKLPNRKKFRLTKTRNQDLVFDESTPYNINSFDLPKPGRKVSQSPTRDQRDPSPGQRVLSIQNSVLMRSRNSYE